MTKAARNTPTTSAIRKPKERKPKPNYLTEWPMREHRMVPSSAMAAQAFLNVGPSISLAAPATLTATPSLTDAITLSAASTDAADPKVDTLPSLAEISATVEEGKKSGVVDADIADLADELRKEDEADRETKMRNIRSKVLAGLAAWQADIRKVNTRFSEHATVLQEHCDEMVRTCDEVEEEAIDAAWTAALTAPAEEEAEEDKCDIDWAPYDWSSDICVEE